MGKHLGIITFLLISCCYAAHPQQVSDANLDQLISNVFGTGDNKFPNQPPPPVQSTTPNIDNIIGQVFPNPPQGGPPQQPPMINPMPPGNIPNIPGNNKGDMPNGDDCECVPYYQCQNGTILDNGVGLIDIRIQGSCNNYLDVCCTPPNRLATPNTPKPNVRIGCGHRNPEGVGFRITGAKDNEAQFGEFPWMIAVLKEDSVGKTNEKLNVYLSGGSLIHPQVVLTAAHYVAVERDPSKLKIRAGEWDTQTKNEIFPHQDRQVQSIVVHERFHGGSLVNDVALLFLSQPVQYADNVDTICLPDSPAMIDPTRCYASGWGKDTFGKEGHYQVILKRVEMPLVPNDRCQSLLRTTRLGYYYFLDKSFICAGGEAGKDTCKGDGGSPLVCPIRGNPDRYVQAGIVSWGIGCGQDQIPGVYANVAYLKPWIDEKMRQFGLNDNEYRFREYA